MARGEANFKAPRELALQIFNFIQQLAGNLSKHLPGTNIEVEKLKSSAQRITNLAKRFHNLFVVFMGENLKAFCDGARIMGKFTFMYARRGSCEIWKRINHEALIVRASQDGL